MPWELGPRRSGRRAVERAAGIVLQVAPDRPALPETADFDDCSADGSAFWLAGDRILGLAGGSRILADAMTEANLSRDTGDFAYTAALKTAAMDRRGAGRPYPTAAYGGDVVAADWVRFFLWFTYHRNEFPQWTSVVLPRNRRLPRFNRNFICDPGPPARAFDHYQVAANTRDPFTGVFSTEMQNINVNGTIAQAAKQPTRGNGNGAVVAAVLLGALMLSQDS
jgi:hypothetical protein